MRSVIRAIAASGGPDQSSASGSLHWYVAETLPRQEQFAVENLSRQAFESFCPRFRKVRKHARRQQTVLAPLFPGYIFVRVDPERHPWRSINGTRGVRRLTGVQSKLPRPMPEAAMEQIFSRCKNGILTQLIESVEPGRCVRVASGPFAQRLGSIEALDEKGRVKVLLEILGAERSIIMNVCDLEPV